MTSRSQRAADVQARRERIVEAAMRHFAEHGYRGGRVEDIANEVGVAKGTVFLDFSNKEGLFLAAYQRAVSSLPAWLDAPEEILDGGFWATLDWWLERTEESGQQDWIANRVAMIGRYDTGLGLRRPRTVSPRRGRAGNG
jgi:AcrR family transcriptional regulator